MFLFSFFFLVSFDSFSLVVDINLFWNEMEFRLSSAYPKIPLHFIIHSIMDLILWTAAFSGLPQTCRCCRCRGRRRRRHLWILSIFPKHQDDLWTKPKSISSPRVHWISHIKWHLHTYNHIQKHTQPGHEIFIRLAGELGLELELQQLLFRRLLFYDRVSQADENHNRNMKNGRTQKMLAFPLRMRGVRFQVIELRLILFISQC